MVENTKTNGGGLQSLYLKEDWWAVWIGLGLVIVALILCAVGQSLGTITVSFKSYDSFTAVPGMVVSLLPKMLFLYITLAAIFSLAAKVMRYNVGKFLAGFTLLFVMAVIVQILGAWNTAKTFNLEAPVMALIVGMIIGNFVKIPDWFESAMRTEFYVKVGIVLMGATLPFTLILESGPVALFQATVIAVTTFLVIYFAATKLFGLEKPFGATLGAGGSICGVSASIAIGSSVNAKKEHVSIAISMVVIWATIMVFLLPVICRLLGLSDGAAGAWIGTSEFADAAGIAAAAQFGDGATTTFTLMKVVGRDIFVGVWAFLLAIISVTVWERKKSSDGTVQKPGAGVIWERFPKFVIGFFIASIIVTIVLATASPDFAALVDSDALKAIKNLRGWAFVFCFLCIGLTTRFKALAATGWKPFAAFTIGVGVNVILGFLFSTVFLNDYWTAVGM
ncbi:MULTISPECIES: YeiH family protein [unclassified Adlercreutzia]|uniref:YeiH family protein n=1 Tax=unclassified Adlercreutzia TaxID=2636013 RepID=UPI0013EB23A4|nr:MULTISPECIES: putative sulfate exporter family transporter [unclassified Adlercreutzia]